MHQILVVSQGTSNIPTTIRERKKSHPSQEKYGEELQNYFYPDYSPFFSNPTLRYLNILAICYLTLGFSDFRGGHKSKF